MSYREVFFSEFIILEVTRYQLNTDKLQRYTDQT
jgi:hypothetical protein